MSNSISFLFPHKIDLNTEAAEFSFDLPKNNDSVESKTSQNTLYK